MMSCRPEFVYGKLFRFPLNLLRAIKTLQKWEIFGVSTLSLVHISRVTAVIVVG